MCLCTSSHAGVYALVVSALGVGTRIGIQYMHWLVCFIVVLCMLYCLYELRIFDQYGSSEMTFNN